MSSRSTFGKSSCVSSTDVYRILIADRSWKEDVGSGFDGGGGGRNKSPAACVERTARTTFAPTYRFE
jgi:hypothetical protein